MTETRTTAHGTFKSGTDTASGLLKDTVGTTAPARIQRKRTRGWKMPGNTVYVGRSGGEWGRYKSFANPFRVGGYFKIGRGAGHGGFAWLEAHKDYADASFTLIETNEQAVGFFRLYRRLYPFKAGEIETLRGKNLACWCRLDQPCHADVLLELANVDGRKSGVASPEPEPIQTVAAESDPLVTAQNQPSNT
jgi:hypothetical protein